MLNFRQEQLLNTTFSQSEFTLDEGEKLLKEMQDLREDLSHYSGVVDALYDRSREVVPLKQRRQPVRQHITVTSICNYKQVEVQTRVIIYQYSLIASFLLLKILTRSLSISYDRAGSGWI